jgi:hypothetical protein
MDYNPLATLKLISNVDDISNGAPGGHSMTMTSGRNARTHKIAGEAVIAGFYEHLNVGCVIRRMHSRGTRHDSCVSLRIRDSVTLVTVINIDCADNLAGT